MNEAAKSLIAIHCETRNVCLSRVVEYSNTNGHLEKQSNAGHATTSHACASLKTQPKFLSTQRILTHPDTRSAKKMYYTLKSLTKRVVL